MRREGTSGGRQDLVSKTIFPRASKGAAIGYTSLCTEQLTTVRQWSASYPWRNCNNYEPHLLNSPLLTAADVKKAEKIPTTKFGKAFYTAGVICHRGLHKSPIFSRFQLAFFFSQFGGQLLLYSIMSQAEAGLSFQPGQQIFTSHQTVFYWVQKVFNSKDVFYALNLTFSNRALL